MFHTVLLPNSLIIVENKVFVNIMKFFRVIKIMIHLLIKEDLLLLTEKMNIVKRGEG